MAISFSKKIIIFLLSTSMGNFCFSQTKYPPVTYKAFAMCIYDKGDTTCNWKKTDIEVKLNIKGDTLNNITINGTKTVTYIVKKRTKSYNEIYAIKGKQEKNKVYWDFYEIYDDVLGEEGKIQWGIFDYPIDGQVSAMSIFLKDYTVVFRLKVP